MIALTVDQPTTRGVIEVRVAVDDDATMIGLRVSIAHQLGRLGGVAPVGERLPLDLSRLPAGPAEVEVAPLRADGSEGAPAVAWLAVPGGGQQPAGCSIKPAAEQMARPARGSRVWVGVELELEPGLPPVVVHLTLRGPADECQYAIVEPFDRLSRFNGVFALDHAAPVGEYRLEAVTISAEGALGDRRTAGFALGDDGVAAPRIDRAHFGRDGTLIVRGSALDGRGLSVLVDGQPAPVMEQRPEQLVALASANVPVPVEVVTHAGHASAAGLVVPDVSVRGVPEVIIVEGSTTMLEAAATGVSDSGVVWEVDGEPPGVTLSPHGQLTVGPDAPDRFTVRADSVASPGNAVVSAVAVISSSAPVTRVGPRGGVVVSEDGRTRLTLRPGALTGPVELRVPMPRTSPATAKRPATTELRLEPRDLAVPALLELGLDCPLDPAAPPSVEALRDGSRLDVAARLDPDGIRLWLELEHLPELLRLHHQFYLDAILPSPLSQPVIMRVAPSTVEEGQTVALLVEGQNFVPGATTVTLIDAAGAVDARGFCGPAIVSGDGRRFGFTLHLRPMTDLSEGSVSYHLLRVATPAGVADHTLPIVGHDELDVVTGQTVTITSSRRFSGASIAAGATVLVPGGSAVPVVLEILSSASIAGTIRVTAADGAPGAGGTGTGLGGAGGPAALSAGGAGGPGGGGNGMGATGQSPMPTALHPVAGAGGGGGGGTSIGYAGNGRAGSSPIDPNFVSPGLTLSQPPFGPGAGGGGGGGGGGAGVIWTTRGGGGGGGGAGGGAIAVIAGESIELTGGRVIAAGGRGGTGGGNQLAPGLRSGMGGDGGGGGGGVVMLHGVRNSFNSFAIAVSGSSGSTPSGTIGDLLQLPGTGAIRVDGFLITSRPTHLAGPDLNYLPELVTSRTTIEVQGADASHVRVTNGFGSTLHATRRYTQVGSVNDPLAGVISGLPTSGLNNFVFVATVRLREGFNDMMAEMDSPGGITVPVPIVSAPLRGRRVLCLPDAIPAYMFSCSITPASPVVPTERSATVQASVTASQPTTLGWSLIPADAGMVTPLPTGARYTAPAQVPGTEGSVFATVLLRAASSLDPRRYAQVPITVRPGIAVGSTASTGTPRNPLLPSANSGQMVTITITPAGLAATPTAFAGVTAIETMLLRPSAAGCERVTYSAQPTLAPGLQSLSFAVPSCVDPEGFVRVPGHGSARLQIVPEITGITGNRAADPGPTINGTGFACGLTKVLVNGTLFGIQSLTCSQILLKSWPWAGFEATVETPGGVSNVMMVP